MIDFAIIGSGKSGSTSLYYYLAQHPQIFLPRIKEPCFFMLPGLDSASTPEQREWYARSYPQGVRTLAEYHGLFEQARPGQKKGEASIQYLESETAPVNLGLHAPQARLIVVLRNPIERVLSVFSHARRDQLEQRSSVLEVLADLGPDHTYFNAGFYAEHLRNYARLAPANPLRVWLYDDLLADPARTVREMFEFIGVDDSFVPDLGLRANVSGTADRGNPWARLYDALRRNQWRRTPLAQKLIPIGFKQWVIKTLGRRADADRRKETLSTPDWQALRELYETDVCELQGMLDKDLSRWLAPPQDERAA